MPIVAQSALDDLRDTIRELRHQLDTASDRYQALLDHYHELRVQGANPKVVPIAPKPPNIVDIAISQAVRGRRGAQELRAAQVAWVEQERQAGKSDAEIALAIAEGQDGTAEEAFG